MTLQTISQGSLDRLAELERHGRSWELLPWNNGQADVIDLLGESGEPAVALHLLKHAFSSIEKTRKSARKAISKLLSAVSIERFMELDAWVRQFTGYWRYGSDRWSKLSPSTVNELTSVDDYGILAFSSMHPNGYVREAAVSALLQRKTGEELGFLLIRANDWVRPIHEMAHSGIVARLQPDYAHYFLLCLPVILQLEMCQRVEHRWLIKEVGGLLLHQDCQQIIQSGLQSQNRDVRMACLRFLQESPSTRTVQALREAMRDRDSMIRLYAARTLLVRTDAAQVAELCGELLRGEPPPRAVAQLRGVSTKS